MSTACIFVTNQILCYFILRTSSLGMFFRQETKIHAKKDDIIHCYSYLYSELMEGQREYYRKKKEIEEMGGAAKNSEDDSKMKEKVTKLIKMRRLAKMAQVLDTSTVCYCHNPNYFQGLAIVNWI